MYIYSLNNAYIESFANIDSLGLLIDIVCNLINLSNFVKPFQRKKHKCLKKMPITTWDFTNWKWVGLSG